MTARLTSIKTCRRPAYTYHRPNPRAVQRNIRCSNLKTNAKGSKRAITACLVSIEVEEKHKYSTRTSFAKTTCHDHEKLLKPKPHKSDTKSDTEGFGSSRSGALVVSLVGQAILIRRYVRRHACVARRTDANTWAVRKEGYIGRDRNTSVKDRNTASDIEMPPPRRKLTVARALAALPSMPSPLTAGTWEDLRCRLRGCLVGLNHENAYRRRQANVR